MGANMAVEQGHCEHGRYSQCDGECEGFIPMCPEFASGGVLPDGYTFTPVESCTYVVDASHVHRRILEDINRNYLDCGE